MARAASIHTDNIVIGAGEVFLDLLDADGNRQGERYVGDSVGMSLSATEERAQVFSGDGPTARKLIDAVTQRDFAGTVTLHDSSKENLALLLQGENPADEADSATAVTDEVVAGVKQGRWYQLGVSATKRMGYLSIASAGFAATDSESSPTTFTAGDDYRIDADNARIYIVPGGSINDGTDLKVDYTPVAATHERAQTKSPPEQVLAAVRYIEHPASGRGRNVYIRRCSVGVAGEVQLKDRARQTEQTFPLTLGVQEPTDGYPSIIIDGKAA